MMKEASSSREAREEMAASTSIRRRSWAVQNLLKLFLICLCGVVWMDSNLGDHPHSVLWSASAQERRRLLRGRESGEEHRTLRAAYAEDHGDNSAQQQRHLQVETTRTVRLYLSLSYVRETVAEQLETKSHESLIVAHVCRAINEQASAGQVRAGATALGLLSVETRSFDTNTGVLNYECSIVATNRQYDAEAEQLLGEPGFFTIELAVDQRVHITRPAGMARLTQAQLTELIQLGYDRSSGGRVKFRSLLQLHPEFTDSLIDVAVLDGGALSPPQSPPTQTPTSEPSARPTTATPTVTPTASPSRAPTERPSDFPSLGPSNMPSSSPSVAPSKTPTLDPTTSPTLTPTILAVVPIQSARPVWITAVSIVGVLFLILVLGVCCFCLYCKKSSEEGPSPQKLEDASDEENADGGVNVASTGKSANEEQAVVASDRNEVDGEGTASCIPRIGSLGSKQEKAAASDVPGEVQVFSDSEQMQDTLKAADEAVIQETIEAAHSSELPPLVPAPPSASSLSLSPSSLFGSIDDNSIYTSGHPKLLGVAPRETPSMPSASSLLSLEYEDDIANPHRPNMGIKPGVADDTLEPGLFSDNDDDEDLLLFAADNRTPSPKKAEGSAPASPSTPSSPSAAEQEGSVAATSSQELLSRVDSSPAAKSFLSATSSSRSSPSSKKSDEKRAREVATFTTKGFDPFADDDDNDDNSSSPFHFDDDDSASSFFDGARAASGSGDLALPAEQPKIVVADQQTEVSATITDIDVDAAVEEKSSRSLASSLTRRIGNTMARRVEDATSIGQDAARQQLISPSEEEKREVQDEIRDGVEYEDAHANLFLDLAVPSLSTPRPNRGRRVRSNSPVAISRARRRRNDDDQTPSRRSASSPRPRPPAATNEDLIDIEANNALLRSVLQGAKRLANDEVKKTSPRVGSLRSAPSRLLAQSASAHAVPNHGTVEGGTTLPATKQGDDVQDTSILDTDLVDEKRGAIASPQKGKIHDNRINHGDMVQPRSGLSSYVQPDDKRLPRDGPPPDVTSLKASEQTPSWKDSFLGASPPSYLAHRTPSPQAREPRRVVPANSLASVAVAGAMLHNQAVSSPQKRPAVAGTPTSQDGMGNLGAGPRTKDETPHHGEKTIQDTPSSSPGVLGIQQAQQYTSTSTIAGRGGNQRLELESEDSDGLSNPWLFDTLEQTLGPRSPEADMESMTSGQSSSFSAGVPRRSKSASSSRSGRGRSHRRTKSGRSQRQRAFASVKAAAAAANRAAATAAATEEARGAEFADQNQHPIPVGLSRDALSPRQEQSGTRELEGNLVVTPVGFQGQLIPYNSPPSTTRKVPHKSALPRQRSSNSGDYKSDSEMEEPLAPRSLEEDLQRLEAHIGKVLNPSKMTGLHPHNHHHQHNSYHYSNDDIMTASSITNNSYSTAGDNMSRSSRTSASRVTGRTSSSRRSHRSSGSTSSASSGRMKRKVLLDVPPGKLGVILAEKNGKGTVVMQIRKESPLNGMLSVGDKIVAVDGVDVSRKSVKELTLIMGLRKEEQRRLTVVTKTPNPMVIAAEASAATTVSKTGHPPVPSKQLVQEERRYRHETKEEQDA